MNIVFYTPVNFVCRDVISLLLKFKNEGHNVVLLSQVPKGAMHQELEKVSICTFVQTASKGKFRMISQIMQLVGFCRRAKADVLFSHLEPTNFVSVIAQFMIRTRVIIFRHHLDLAQISMFGNSLSYRLTYKLARTIITVSARSKQYMQDIEKIDVRKIYHINLGYDFNLYPEISEASVRQLRSRYQARVLLLAVGRLDRFKRPEISLNCLKILRGRFHVDAKLIFLGQGELLEDLRILTEKNHLSDHVFFPGFVPNVMTYMAASDYLIHPSISESSSVAIKEASLVNLPVLVCKDVGDFNEFIVHEVNGFLFDSSTMAEEGASLIAKYSSNPVRLREIAESLKAEVRQRFAIDTTFLQFKQILK